MNLESVIFELCSAFGVSGSESKVFDVIKKHLGAETHTIGESLYAVLGDPDADKTILLDAHIDRIGFIITDVNDEGFVKVDKVGCRIRCLLRKTVCAARFAVCRRILRTAKRTRLCRSQKLGLISACLPKRSSGN